MRRDCTLRALLLPDVRRFDTPSFVGHRKYIDLTGDDLVNDAIGVKRKFSHVFIASFWNGPVDAWSLVEDAGLVHQCLNDLLRIVRGVVGDVFENMAQV